VGGEVGWWRRSPAVEGVVGRRRWGRAGRTHLLPSWTKNSVAHPLHPVSTISIGHAITTATLASTTITVSRDSHSYFLQLSQA
jgi:hypothetical protein